MSRSNKGAPPPTSNDRGCLIVAEIEVACWVVDERGICLMPAPRRARMRVRWEGVRMTLHVTCTPGLQ